MTLSKLVFSTQSSVARATWSNSTTGFFLSPPSVFRSPFSLLHPQSSHPGCPRPIIDFPFDYPGLIVIFSCMIA